ncbi:MAG: HAMP domain-containing sensor histidine kinase [Verrucomicrobiota bacterium]
MSIRKSIRWRIQSWHGTLLLAMCAGFGFTAYQLEKSNTLRHADQELDIRLSTLTSTLGQGGGGGGPPGERPPPPDGRRPPPGEGPPGFRSSAVTGLFETKGSEPFYYQVWTRRNTLLAKSPSAPAGIPQPANAGNPDRTIRTRAGMREFYMFTPPGECLLVGRSMAGVDRELRELAWKLTGVGLAVLAFGLIVGWWIATRALRPISQISAAATRIARGNLKERIRTSETESELGKLASLLDDTFQRLDAAFEEQARFTSDAAHELRTPVSIILAQSQLVLSRERSAEDYREAIIISQRAATRMHGLIESLLQLAVLDASEKPADLQPCDLAEIATEQLSMLHSVAEEKEISIISGFSPAPCVANAGHLTQIVVNLVTNAVKFSPAGSEIHVTTTVENGSAKLTVRDNGPGISTDHLPHLFERFYRADSSRNRATGGAGLGLAICKRIAEAHGGRISVESIVGKGSTFILAIPQAPSPTPPL